MEVEESIPGFLVYREPLDLISAEVPASMFTIAGVQLVVIMCFFKWTKLIVINSFNCQSYPVLSSSSVL